MMASLDVMEGGRKWAELELQDVSGLGRLRPRLQLVFNARPERWASVELTDVTVRLERRNELIGEGRIVGQLLRGQPWSISVEVPTTQHMLRFVTDGIAPDARVVDLDVRLSGRGRVRVDSETQPPGMRTQIDDPELGQWKRVVLSHNLAPKLQIPRSEWWGRVLAPTRFEQYRYLEIALPRDDSALGAQFQKAADLLVGAEQAYAQGNDPSVFQQLRGALDALPGAKQHILDNIRSESKRQKLDTLLKATGQYLHVGRHVDGDGVEQGTFPVDHLDASFALDLMRVVVSHLSLMLSAQRERD